ncbi:hypothetical protein CAOG_004350 [Capsaspora owczarzaki ATCC 30864]|uniref:LIM zinc-binding domain-containing protein n=1 Tax=Capsaspora owczarzaki (strain ATCC 30864) TaxID=595528 RepID=A0A0D2WPZ4_CAPO3|nr:hypothetical protein CAOG_004350 [Capsaspora owczarzaki ATCC 30864]
MSSPFPSDNAGSGPSRPTFLDDQRCGSCGKIIQGEFVKLGKKAFHETCVKCAKCTKQLTMSEAFVKVLKQKIRMDGCEFEFGFATHSQLPRHAHRKTRHSAKSAKIAQKAAA